VDCKVSRTDVNRILRGSCTGFRRNRCSGAALRLMAGVEHLIHGRGRIPVHKDERICDTTTGSNARGNYPSSWRWLRLVAHASNAVVAGERPL
jgi:hypothetical protein